MCFADDPSRSLPAPRRQTRRWTGLETALRLFASRNSLCRHRECGCCRCACVWVRQRERQILAHRRIELKQPTRVRHCRQLRELFTRYFGVGESVVLDEWLRSPMNGSVLRGVLYGDRGLWHCGAQCGTCCSYGHRADYSHCATLVLRNGTCRSAFSLAHSPAKNKVELANDDFGKQR